MVGRLNRMRKRSAQLHDVTLTPLIDTALVLVVIFMVASPMMHTGIKLNLPKGKTDEAKSIHKPVTVSIDKQGSLYLNDEQVSDMASLIDNLKQIVTLQNEQAVYVHADAGCSYGVCYEVIDKIKYIAGVENVVLSAHKIT